MEARSLATASAVVTDNPRLFLPCRPKPGIGLHHLVSRLKPDGAYQRGDRRADVLLESAILGQGQV
jgi:hypothetical protein